MDYVIRRATLEERPSIERLIVESARGLSRQDYSEQQIEAAIASVFGVDTDLIVDGTYFVADVSGTLVGCGGWSRRKTLFGGDRCASRDASQLDPSEPAKIRAFFVRPGWARRGIGRAILTKCEGEARAHGFRSLELMSTLPGLRSKLARIVVDTLRAILYGPGIRTRPASGIRDRRWSQDRVRAHEEGLANGGGRLNWREHR